MNVISLVDRVFISIIVCFFIYIFFTPLLFSWYVLFFGVSMFLTFTPYYIKLIYWLYLKKNE